MANVYFSGLALLGVSYFAQLFLRAHASSQMIFVFGVYLILINLSVVAESVVFVTPAKGSSHHSKRVGRITGFIITVLLDPIVIVCVSLIAVMYLYLHGAKIGSIFSIFQMTGVVVLSFWLRIAESSAKSFASRSGNYREQQIVINIFSSVKWIAISVAVMLSSELGIYVCISLISLLVISVLARFSNDYFSGENVQQKDMGTDRQRWLMLLATVIGTIGYQFDKMLAIKYLDKGVAGFYVLSYSLIFMLIQALGPLYNKYISEQWVEKNSNAASVVHSDDFLKIVLLLAYIGSLLNLAVIVLFASYFGHGFHGSQEIVDVIWLSMAVLVCALNHVYYFSFAASRRYDKIFYQNLSGLAFGGGAAIVAVVRDFEGGVAFIPFFVNVGQYMFILINNCLRIDLNGWVSFKMALLEVAKIVISLGGVVGVGLVALESYSTNTTQILMAVITGFFIMASIFILQSGHDGGLIHNMKKTFLDARKIQ